jgi:hypothetical protein
MTDAEALRRVIVARDASEVLRRVIEECVTSEFAHPSVTRSRPDAVAQAIAAAVISRMGRLSLLAVDLP